MRRHKWVIAGCAAALLLAVAMIFISSGPPEYSFLRGRVPVYDGISNGTITVPMRIYSFKGDYTAIRRQVQAEFAGQEDVNVNILASDGVVVARVDQLNGNRRPMVYVSKDMKYLGHKGAFEFVSQGGWVSIQVIDDARPTLLAKLLTWLSLA